ncbi:putative RNA-directed DNA polymerase [Helianthus annuus]|nr:putative RNA-directed DNA polymerase [Helianthus annuus]
MHQPMGFRDATYPNHVCLLKKSLYGLKQAPRAWYQRFADFMSKMGFQHSKCDHSLFIFKQGSHMAYILLYVDDILLITSTNDLREKFMALLSKEFAMTDLGPLSYFLGISVTRSNNSLFLSQEKYAREILKRAGLTDCKPAATPVDTQNKLSNTHGSPVDNITEYRSFAGALQYLTFTRPNISYAVQQVCLHMHDPKTTHLNALKRILRYVKGTITYGLHLQPSQTSSLVAYTDAD